VEHLESKPTLPARVVVLGATGFVGQDLIMRLQSRGIEVLPLSSREIDLAKPEATEKLKNLVRDRDSLVIVSALTPDKGKDVATLVRNLSMVQNVAAFLEETQCAHVVYISSDAVYADDANPVRETSCCDPSSFHGLMHLVRERVLAAAVQKQGTPLMILRPTAIYGAADTHNSYGPNRFLRTALKNREIKLFGMGEEKRDHLCIKDLSEITLLSLERRSQGVLNVATGESVSFFDLAEMIKALCGNETRIEGSPRANPVTHRHFEISALYKGFPEFRFTMLADGLTESFAIMKRSLVG